MHSMIRSAPFVIVAVALTVWTNAALAGRREAVNIARALPAPMVDLPTAPAASAVVVLAGGCFWGVQGVFQHVTGVTSAVSGYTGGEHATASYEKVGRRDTGHAESVQVTYDPRRITYGQLLQIFFSVVHDPTEHNRQGPDVGPEYRSAVFPVSAQQAEVAHAYIAQLDRAGLFKKAIATSVEMNRTFYPAEAYHQNYLAHNPRSPYILMYDLPKIEALKQAFPELYRSDAVLVDEARSTR